MSIMHHAWTRKARFLVTVTLSAVFTLAPGTALVEAGLRQDQAVTEEKSQAAQYGQQLSSRDALLRQRAAEEIARVVAVDQRKLIEGHRLQESNARVKLALDWALFRLGRNESLFNVVQQLGESSRADQARGYLMQIEGPAPLYIFLDRAPDKVKLKLMEVLGEIGDANTAERLRVFASSENDKLADASRKAINLIDERLSRASTESVSRPRRSGSGDEKPN